MRTPKPKHSFNRTNQAACRFLKQTQKAIIRLNSLGLAWLCLSFVTPINKQLKTLSLLIAHLKQTPHLFLS